MTDQCQVDFYVLQKPEQSAEQLACRLALMAWEQGKRITVVTKDNEAAAQLDELMWISPAGRFLPHSTAPANETTPVVICTSDSVPADHNEVIINLTGKPVPEPARFKRLLEIVPADEAERKTSRLKFRFYRNMGLEPASHPIN